MYTSNTPHQNRLLAALPEAVMERLAPHLELIPLTAGEALYESGDKMRYIYFPTTAIISLLYVMKNGATAEISMVGNEGITGIPLFMGGETTPNRSVVQCSGYAYQLEPNLLKQEFNRSGGRRAGTLQLFLLRYTQALITQMAQTAVCNRHHTVDQQLCRWMLQTHDRLCSDHLYMTQEAIAGMLGVRREGVTEAAGKLQKAGLIKYSRGHITIIDRSGLEERSCECYGVVKREYDRLLPPLR
ncbi:MAG TPA: Crp/Fnr family transcriptional regulator [Rhodocyclaceae bacterium]|nr:Crp/Fnr family transcriptional regulator [Rhodocyclaceae bacterium]